MRRREETPVPTQRNDAWRKFQIRVRVKRCDDNHHNRRNEEGQQQRAEHPEDRTARRRSDIRFHVASPPASMMRLRPISLLNATKIPATTTTRSMPNVAAKPQLRSVLI